MNIKYMSLLPFLFVAILIKGESDYEQFKRTYNCDNCDLSGHDLHAVFRAAYKRNKKVSLRGANLSKTKMSRIKAKQADFTDANLDDADLTFSNLRNAIFDNASLNDTRFSYTKAKFASFKNIELKRTTFYSANLNDTDFENSKFGEGNIINYDTRTNLRDATAKGANFRNTTWKNVNAENCDATDADFTGAEFSTFVGKYDNTTGFPKLD